MRRFSRQDILRLKGILQGKPVIGPRVVNVHLTNACDRKCRFCWYFSPLVSWNSKRIDMDHDVLVKLIHDCAEIGVEEMNFEGGEIVLYPGISDIFRLVPRLGMLLTAYTHLAYGCEHLQYLWNADRLNVNLSAATAKTYRIIHGGDRFADVLNNLYILAAIKRRRGKPKVTLTFIINEVNYKEIEPFLRLADDADVDAVKFRLFEATVEMKSLVFSQRSAGLAQRIITRVKECRWRVSNNLEDILGILSDPEFLKDPVSMARTTRNNDRFIYCNILKRNTTKCYRGWFYSFIDERGRVIAPCDNIGVCIAGNIYRESFKDIWFHSGRFQKIRDEALHGIDIRKKRWLECRYCRHAEFNRSVQNLLGQ